MQLKKDMVICTAALRICVKATVSLGFILPVSFIIVSNYKTMRCLMLPDIQRKACRDPVVC